MVVLLPHPNDWHGAKQSSPAVMVHHLPAYSVITSKLFAEPQGSVEHSSETAGIGEALGILYEAQWYNMVDY